MKCIDGAEIKEFAGGRLQGERLMEVDEHIRGCAECKAALDALGTREKLGMDLGAALLGVADCPEYEDLSAFVDGALDQDRAKSVRVHANMCEFCDRDISSIQEMRSHAALRENVAVRPGTSRQAGGSRVSVWKRAIAVVSAAAVVAAVAFGIGDFLSAPKDSGMVAKKPPIVKQSAPEKREPAAVEKTAKNAPETPSANAVKPARPSYATLLADGSYRVIKHNGRMVLAKAGPIPARTDLERGIAASIEEKLRTGKVKPDKPVQMAMVAIKMRDGEAYVPPPTAPTLTAPVAKIVLSARPVLAWSKVDLAESYRVRIFDKSGTVVLDEITSKNSFMPAGPLERGKLYSWRVGVRFSESDSWAESAAARFEVVSDSGLASIDKVKRLFPGSHLALGAVYESLGLSAEAVSEYRALRRLNHGSKLAGKLL